jgi:GNAT superfamily N-acetyltransferase
VKPGIEIRVLSGADVAAYIDDIATLRIIVFREYPYLYDGTLEAERKYLRHYADNPRAVVIIAMDDGRMAGAVTGIPLAGESPELLEPFRAQRIAVEGIYYVGEMMFYREYRAKGLGSRLWRHLETHARGLGGFDTMACATVARPDDHPCRPPGYLPIDRFCLRHGLVKQPELAVSLGWQEIDGAQHVNRLVFWLKPLAGANQQCHE